MSAAPIRVLLVADTHIGHDWPRRPRVDRPRRGPDFLVNFERALAPALRGEVDLVVHGGDLLFRSKVWPELVQRAMAPLFRVADAGVPVYLVPGNHERSRVPFPLLAVHPGVFPFDRPRTYSHEVRGTRVSLSGFPYLGGARDGFRATLDATAWRDHRADVRLLCLHQLIEGARVGLRDFAFTHGPEVIRARDLPPRFDAVLSGHVHRAQVLRADLAGRPLPAPVVYPGSVERTSGDERGEEKGYQRLTLSPTPPGSPAALAVRFVRLPTRPWIGLPAMKMPLLRAVSNH